MIALESIDFRKFLMVNKSIKLTIPSQNFKHHTKKNLVRVMQEV